MTWQQYINPKQIRKCCTTRRVADPCARDPDPGLAFDIDICTGTDLICIRIQKLLGSGSRSGIIITGPDSYLVILLRIWNQI